MAIKEPPATSGPDYQGKAAMPYERCSRCGRRVRTLRDYFGAHRYARHTVVDDRGTRIECGNSRQRIDGGA